MPHSIPAGLTREHVQRTLSDLDAGMDHPFGTPTDFELIDNEKPYNPNAVVGLACRYSIGRILQPDEFSGGEAPGQANFVLRSLGFTVVKKAEAEKELLTGQDWTAEEVRLVVADYFEMLAAELLNQPYNKTEHRRALLPQLSGRSNSSIEFKHRNVSSVLVDMGLPYIDGYKPKSRRQTLLYEEVESFLEQRPDFLQQLASAPLLNPTEPKTVPKPDFKQLYEDPPTKRSAPIATKPWLSRKARKIDFAEQDAANRLLGKLGEQFVYELEQHRLNMAGRDDLARKVIWASRDIGDGLGFDIITFDEADDSERMVEVKATGLGKYFPFYVTSNEVRCSEDIPHQYCLFRVFDFGRSPHLFVLHGSLRERCDLEPVLYRTMI